LLDPATIGGSQSNAYASIVQRVGCSPGGLAKAAAADQIARQMHASLNTSHGFLRRREGQPAASAP